MPARPFLLALLAFFLFSCSLHDHTTTHYRVPAEWEQQDTLWMGFRSEEWHLANRITATDSLTLELIRQITAFIPMKLVVENDTLIPGGKSFFSKQGIDTNRIDIFFQKPTDFWYRDPGPVFAVSDKGELAVADFKYTNYANVPIDSIGEKAKAHEKIDKNVAARLNIPTIELKVALEGGGFETNGKGIAIQNEELTLRRNPGLTKKQIEQNYKKIGIDKVIWVKWGLADDAGGKKIGNYYVWGAGGHTDEFVRFANDSTILLAWVNEKEIAESEINKENDQRMKEDLRLLEKATNVNGKKFTIIKLPLPPFQLYTAIADSAKVKRYMGYHMDIHVGDSVAETSCSSYLNFILTNGLVVIPAYWKEGMSSVFKEADEEALKIFQRLFSDRKIIQLNPLELNWDGGGMHCIYQPQPASRKK